MKDRLNTIILSVAILIAIVIYCFCTRYQIVASGGGDLIRGFQVDRMTGETWVLTQGIKKGKQEEEPPTQPSPP